jgi:S1-C subfamily serine protease
MVSARIWLPGLLALAAAAYYGAPIRDSVIPPRAPPSAPAVVAESAWTAAPVAPVPSPRISAPSVRKASRPRAEPLEIVPLNPDLGFVVDSQALEWLPAGLALRAGDAVLRINGEPVVSTAQLLDAVRGASEGSAVELGVRRSGGQEVSYWAAP